MNFTKLTNEIQKHISESLVYSNAKYLADNSGWNEKTTTCFLAELYLNVREHFASKSKPIEIPVGIFNRVISDMARAGLFTVDRKKKEVSNIAFEKLSRLNRTSAASDEAGA
jgi:hypothetical protein